MTDNVLELGISPMRYDITLPLTEGRVKVDGVQFRPDPISAMVFADNPRLREGDFGLCDFNLGYLLPAIEAGWQIVALPVFPKRKPMYQFIFCRSDAAIRSPRDLEGKRIGTSRYRTALTVWTRGLLKEEFGVDISTFKWVVADSEFLPIFDERANIERAANPSAPPVEWLLNGEVDALITDISDAKLFAALEGNPGIHRLFPQYREEDFNLYKRTGIFTPVHVMVMSKKLDRQDPDLAARLVTAFGQAKEIAYDDTLSDRGGFSTVYLREGLQRQLAEWGDPWRYGVSANQTMIDTFIRYNTEQRMIRSSLTCDEIFARSTLNT